MTMALDPDAVLDALSLEQISLLSGSDCRHTTPSGSPGAHVRPRLRVTGGPVADRRLDGQR
jgi:hypothetical protein